MHICACVVVLVHDLILKGLIYFSCLVDLKNTSLQWDYNRGHAWLSVREFAVVKGSPCKSCTEETSAMKNML